jgi:PKD repeat protein
MGKRSKATEVIQVLEKPKDVELEIRTTPMANPKDNRVVGTVPFQVTFDASRSQVGEIVEWQWDFEDDGIMDEFSQAVQHTYREPGEYNVRLKIIDADENEYETTQRVLVQRSGIRADISAQPTSGSVPLTIEFDGSGSATDEGQIIDYIWEFPGEDPIHYNAQISYEFRKVGIFPVRLTILTSTGKTDTTEIMVSVRSKALRANFQAQPDAGKAPLKVVFDPSGTEGTIFEYFWDFGDGATSREYKPTHIYEETGEYLVTLKVTNSKGLVSSTEKIVHVR